MTRTRVLLAATLLALCGCVVAESPTPTATGLSCDEPAPAQPDCARVEGLLPLTVAPHPGGGAEVVVRLVDACGDVPLPAAYATCLAAPVGAVVVPRALAPGYLLLLAARPRDAAEASATQALVEAIVRSRPAEEAIALGLAGERPAQVSDFTTDHDRLQRLARALVVALGDGDEGSLDGAVAAARAATRAVGGAGPPVLRAVVAIAREPLPPASSPPEAVIVVPASAAGELAAEAARVSAVLDTAAAAGAAGVGVCGAADLEIAAAGKAHPLALPRPHPEEARLPCSAERAARGERTPPRRLEFVFDADQRTEYADILAKRSRRDFQLSVRLGDADPVPAKAHLRGHGSMLCERQSYSVNLATKGPRPLVGGVVDDEFLLLSMCWDQAYIENHAFDQVLATMGFFPFGFDYVEVVVDGQAQGLYLLMEKPHEALREDHARPVGVVRRNHEGEGDRLDVKLFVDPGDWIVEAYEALLSTARSLSGEKMVTAMRGRMAFDHYLRYIATMTVLRNSDYGDEVRFLGTEQPGSPGVYFEVSAWDPEDILRLDCVWEQYAFFDPAGLVWCAEGKLEHAVLADPVAYALYVEELEETLRRLTPELLADALERTRERILPYLDDPRIIAAMASARRWSNAVNAWQPETQIEPTREAFVAEIDRRARIIQGRFVKHRAELAERLAAYRARTR
jgi:hypothetical protein